MLHVPGKRPVAGRTVVGQQLLGAFAAPTDTPVRVAGRATVHGRLHLGGVLVQGTFDERRSARLASERMVANSGAQRLIGWHLDLWEQTHWF